jgi:hypothetical protein
MNEAEQLQSTLISIFKRRGHDGDYTRLFENLEPAHRETLLSRIELERSELPVIGSVEGDDNWLIFTTERVVWHSAGREQSLRVQDIRDVVVDFKGLVSTDRNKEEMKELQVVCANGERQTLALEAGAPLVGVWNALKNLGARNRRQA